GAAIRNDRRTNLVDLGLAVASFNCVIGITSAGFQFPLFTLEWCGEHVGREKMYVVHQVTLFRDVGCAGSFYVQPAFLASLAAPAFPAVAETQQVTFFFHAFAVVVGLVIHYPLVFLSEKHRREFYIPKQRIHAYADFAAACHRNRFL